MIIIKVTRDENMANNIQINLTFWLKLLFHFYFRRNLYEVFIYVKAESEYFVNISWKVETKY